MSENNAKKDVPVQAWLTYVVDGNMLDVWQEFPTTQRKLEAALKEENVPTDMLEKVSEAMYMTEPDVLDRHLPSQPDLDELNYLATRIDSMPELERLTFNAAVEANINCGSMTELINLTHNLDAFDLYPGSFTGKEFGGIMFEMHANEHAEVWDRLRTSDDPHEKAFAVYVERLETSLDLQKYGVHASRDDNGILTGNGYLLLPDEPLPEKYTGPKDIPAEHRLTAPSAEPDRKPSLLGQLAAAKEQAVDTARPDAPEKKAPSGPEL